MATYDPDLSLTDNLENNGFGHRACSSHGTREIFNIHNGEIIGRMHHDQATDWLKARAAKPNAKAVTTTCIEHAYGSAARLSFQIKVFYPRPSP